MRQILTGTVILASCSSRSGSCQPTTGRCLCLNPDCSCKHRSHRANAPSFHRPHHSRWTAQDAIPVDARIGLTLTVDEKGQPQDVQVIQGINPFWDARIVDAVRKFHYRPGTIDNKPTPVDLNLTVTIAR